jgi:ABC-type lipoprotein release transport system permease subunit
MTKLFPRIRIILSLALRNMLRNKRRTSITLASVVLGVGSTLILAGIARGMAQQLIHDSIYTLTGHIKIQHPRSVDDPSVEYTIKASQELLARVNAIAGVIAVLPRLRVNSVIQSEREAAPVSLVGINPGLEHGSSLAGSPISTGKMLRDPKDTGIVLGEFILPSLKSELQKRLVILTQDLEGEIASRGFRIIGTYRAEVRNTEKQFAFTGIESLRMLLGIPEHEYHEISLVLQNEHLIPSVIQELLRLFPEATVKSWEELQPLVVSMTKLQNGFLIIWFFIVVISVSFGTINALLMSIFERVREIAIMNSLGMNHRWIIGETILQAFFLLLLGGIMGLLLGMITLYGYMEGGINVAQFAEGTSIVGVGDRIYPIIYARDAFTILGLLTGLGTLGCVYPAWLAARIRPDIALKKF